MNHSARTLLLLCMASIAAAAMAAQPAAPPDEKLAEVLVQADREKLSALHGELVDLQDQFFEKYNDLNTDRRFKVHCAMETRTMTRIRKRVCRPAFAEDAERDESIAFLDGHGSTPAVTITRLKDRELKENIRKMTAKNPELRKALIAWGQANDRFEKFRAEKMREHVLVSD